MSIRVQTEFVRKGTVRIIVYVYNDAGVLTDSTSVNISIKDPGGTIVKDEQDMGKTSTGTYEYFYTTDEDVEEGDYQIEAWIVDGSYKTPVYGHFSMVAGINEAAEE